jgi:hypothetical protein
LAAGFFLFATLHVSASAQGEIYSEGGGSDDHGNQAFWRISSTAEPLSRSPSTACNSIRASVFLPPSIMSPQAGQEAMSSLLYCYVYTVQNNGTNRIKVSLPGSDVIRSPLATVMQDFSIEVSPNDSSTLVFVAASDPKQAFSPVDIAIWDGAIKQWGFIRSGPASLYLPSRPNLIDVAFMDK